MIVEMRQPGARHGTFAMVVVKLGTMFGGVGHDRVRSEEIGLG